VRYLRKLYFIPLFYSTTKARCITNRISKNYIADRQGVCHVSHLKHFSRKNNVFTIYHYPLTYIAICRYTSLLSLFFLPTSATKQLVRTAVTVTGRRQNFSRHKSTNENMKINPSTHPFLPGSDITRYTKCVMCRRILYIRTLHYSFTYNISSAVLLKQERLMYKKINKENICGSSLLANGYKLLIIV